MVGIFAWKQVKSRLYIFNLRNITLKKIVSAVEAAKFVKENSSVMIGGFLRCGSPYRIIDELIKNKTSGLTLIANDTSCPESDRGKLIVNKLVKKAIVSHIGLNPETGRQMNAGELEVELVPMGTLVERIRAAGAGLGGVITPTGVGTLVENGKTVMEIEGKKYLLEMPLRADIAIIHGSKVDKYGNVFLHGTSKNFNLVMATAATTVIVEAEEMVEDCLHPNEVTIPNIFIDYVVIVGEK